MHRTDTNMKINSAHQAFASLGTEFIDNSKLVYLLVSTAEGLMMH